jgi:hypothetical protein
MKAIEEELAAMTTSTGGASSHSQNLRTGAVPAAIKKRI